jgi:CMP-N,N'-diacetyllegionaminic acid synthase
MRVLGLIPARGGSKGVPRKNVREVCGKPLLQYTAEAALDAHGLSRVILSTDDEEIAAVGRACGLEVPFMRPAELAEDETPMMPVVHHALGWLAERGSTFDAVCLLAPCTPLRRAEDIDGAIALLERTGADSVISFVAVGDKHPARMKYIDDEGRAVDPPFAERVEGQRRQDLPRLYLREGSIYLTRTRVILEQRSFKGRDCRAWLVPEDRACNVDAPIDLLVAEQLLLRAQEHSHAG